MGALRQPFHPWHVRRKYPYTQSDAEKTLDNRQEQAGNSYNNQDPPDNQGQAARLAHFSKRFPVSLFHHGVEL
jgi:hypothetical protein